MKLKIRGKVFSGRGEGSFFVSIYSKEFRKVLGFNPYPGTLNIKIEEEDLVGKYSSCLRKMKHFIIEPPRIPGAKLGKVLVYPAIFNGLNVYIVRPAITVYKLDVIELIAEESLRETFSLKDGDEVEVEINC